VRYPCYAAQASAAEGIIHDSRCIGGVFVGAVTFTGSIIAFGS